MEFEDHQEQALLERLQEGIEAQRLGMEDRFMPEGMPLQPIAPLDEDKGTLVAVDRQGKGTVLTELDILRMLPSRN